MHETMSCQQSKVVQQKPSERLPCYTVSMSVSLITTLGHAWPVQPLTTIVVTSTTTTKTKTAARHDMNSQYSCMSSVTTEREVP